MTSISSMAMERMLDWAAGPHSLVNFGILVVTHMARHIVRFVYHFVTLDSNKIKLGE